MVIIENGRRTHVIVWLNCLSSLTLYFRRDHHIYRSNLTKRSLLWAVYRYDLPRLKSYYVKLCTDREQLLPVRKKLFPNYLTTHRSRINGWCHYKHNWHKTVRICISIANELEVARLSVKMLQKVQWNYLITTWNIYKVFS